MNYIPTLQTAKEKWAPGKLFSSDEVKMLLDLIEAQSEREKALREACEWIVQLSRGWDQDGSLGPRVPLSWESVGRMAMDYARSALATPPGA